MGYPGLLVQRTLHQGTEMLIISINPHADKDLIPQILYSIGMLLFPVIVLGKCSIFLLYLQIFIPDRTMKLGIWSGLIVTPITYLPQLVVHTIYLAPRSGQSWGDLVQSGTSNRGVAFSVVQAIQASLTVVLDLYIFVLPLPRIWMLQQPRSKRLQIMAVFSTAVM